MKSSGRLLIGMGAMVMLAVRVQGALPAPAAKPAVKPVQNTELLARALAGELKERSQVVFAARNVGTDPHWYANFGYWSEDASKMMYGVAGARLVRLDLVSGKARDLVNDPAGGIRDPAVDYDGAKVLFSWRKGGAKQYHLYEINVDGTGLRQITDGPFDDIEPCYLPGGDIVFVSSRCRRWVSCWYTQVAILHRCTKDGKEIRPISANIEQDNTPAVMPDGRVLYTRWEYIDRSQVDFHHLWTTNPDGTNVQTWFGNLHAGTVMIDARPIPGTDKVAAIFSSGHGRTEHVGDLRVVSPEAGPDERSEALPVSGCPPAVRDPYPISGSLFLVARKNQVLLVDAAAGAFQIVYEDKQEVHEPRLVRRQAREPRLLERADLRKETGRLILADVHVGRNMAGVRAGEIKKLLVLEALPKPVNFSGGPEPLTWLGTFNLERVLGTVPVEADGSAQFELPANRPFTLVALDANDLSVKRMQSFVSVMPGETTSCIGCHESRSQSGALPAGGGHASLLALQKPAARITPFEGVPDVISYPRDVQPILDRRCVSCHSYDKPDGGIVLGGDRGAYYSQSWWTLMAADQVADGRNGYGNRPPRTIGSSASRLMDKIGGAHYGVRLEPVEWRTIWMWIESGATFGGTYAALATGMVGPSWPAIPDAGEPAPKDRAAAVLQRRCGACHASPRDPQTNPGWTAPAGKVLLPHPRNHVRQPGPGVGVHERLIVPNDPLVRRSIHTLWNLSRPEKSIALLAPLAREAGGWGTCEAAAGKTVLTSTTEADYLALLDPIRRNAERLNAIKRFDMAGFRPNNEYVREMKRFGILPPAFDLARDPIDVYATDQAYWRSLWWTPMSSNAP
jgi:hypothetical protein